MVGALGAEPTAQADLKAAQTALQQGALPSAERLANRALQSASLSDGDREAALLVLGMAESGLGKADAALADLDKAVALKPGDANAWLDRGEARMRAKGPGAGLDDIDAAIKLKSDWPRAYALKGDALRASGDLAG